MDLDTSVLVLTYFCAAKLALVLGRGARFELLSLLNLCAVAVLFDWGEDYRKLVGYVSIFVAHYVLTFAGTQSRLRYLAGIIFPLVILILLKYLPDGIYESIGLQVADSVGPTAIGLIGLSYMAFRTSYLTVEVYNLGVPQPSFSQYFAFAFFIPTFSIGPISRYRGFLESTEDQDILDWRPSKNSIDRILKGAVKYFFLAPIFAQIDYNGLLLDGNKHHPVDLVVASVAFYAYIYCNFSGFCDMAIGAAGLLRIRVDENFNKPYLARNVQDFWNRWHMTLNTYMKDMVFTNLTKFMVKAMGAQHLNLCLSFSILTVFLLIGLWHGRAWNFVIFGLLHGTAVVVTHWYGVSLRKFLTPKQFRAYQANQYFRWVAIAVTFIYLSATFAIFANDLETLSRLNNAIDW